MAAAHAEAISAFIEGAPPGELDDVVKDIRTLSGGDKALQAAQSAFQKYNEEQLTTVKLPGGSQEVIISQHNSLGNGRYFDVESSSSFAFDHVTQKASAVQSHTSDSPHSDLVKSLLKALSTYTAEHYPTSSYTAVPSSSDNSIAILIVANKYSPSNFWTGRWRNTYIYNPSSSTKGTIKVDVHYYEEGNVRLVTKKEVELSISSSATAQEIVRQIGQVEKAYQEELNRGFAALSEGAFKALRRQLPVTRQKMDWDKVGGYRLGQDIGGGASRIGR